MLGELVEQVKKRGGKNKLWKHEMSFQFLAPGKPCWTWFKNLWWLSVHHRLLFVQLGLQGGHPHRVGEGAGGQEESGAQDEEEEEEVGCVGVGVGIDEEVTNRRRERQRRQQKRQKENRRRRQKRRSTLRGLDAEPDGVTPALPVLLPPLHLPATAEPDLDALNAAVVASAASASKPGLIDADTILKSKTTSDSRGLESGPAELPVQSGPWRHGGTLLARLKLVVFKFRQDSLWGKFKYAKIDAQLVCAAF